MKVKCSFCGNMISDTLDVCPHCGAPNSGVKRSTSDQPLTIEDLKKWYSDRNLPPYEVTRFFIGIDYRKPRAFGIYFDENTGNYVVYKNKDSGQRAVRYEGTDEAYAVNELWMRLKQEILQQKQANRNPASNGTSSRKKKSLWQPKTLIGKTLKWFITATLGLCGITAAFFGVLILIGSLIMLTEPKEGYYQYEGATYYRSGLEYGDDSWYLYSKNEWSAPIPDERMPGELIERSSSKPYFLSSSWNQDLHCTDFSQSIYAKDLQTGLFPEKGYYFCQDNWYYHLVYRFDEGWFLWHGNWAPIDYRDLDEPMQHSSLCKDYFYSENYRKDIPTLDFCETIYYKDSIASEDIEKGYYLVDDHIFYHLADNFTEGWYTYENEEWLEAYELPEAFSHPSTIQDFYYTPTWDASTQFTDFEDTPLYRSDKDQWSDHSDSIFDWGSDDSWDSDDSDWDSDW